VKLLVYVEILTPRVQYIFGHLLGEMLGIEHELTTEISSFIDYSGPKISYSRTVQQGLHFQATDLLFSSEVQSIEISSIEHDGVKAFFPVEQSVLPFDPFAAAFYFLSRYEEYTNTERDRHGRFLAENSALTKSGSLTVPVVDHFAKMVLEKIQMAFPEVHGQLKEHKDLFTIDVDNGFAFKGRGLRSKAAILNAQLKGKYAEAKERKAVLAGTLQDPYDNYKKICEYVNDPKALIFFVLFAERGENDHGADPGLKDFQEAIKEMSKGAEVGIHPSYASNDVTGVLEAQAEQLGQVIGKSIIKSRQHFLRFDLPTTYRRLASVGITEEHSMGYADRAGFRAGTCRPFKWYDLSNEQKTDLNVIPFACMDTAYADHLGLGPEGASTKIKKVLGHVRQVNGPLVSVWHDRVLAGRDEYTGWWKVFEGSIDLCRS